MIPRVGRLLGLAMWVEVLRGHSVKVGAQSVQIDSWSVTEHGNCGIGTNKAVSAQR
jgi:hypothetical protein